MNTKKPIAHRARFLAAGAALAMLAIAPYASASVVRINFSGTAGSGYADLTIAPDPNANPLYDPNVGVPTPTLSKYDPAGAAYITGATGTFDGVAITGILPTDMGVPPLLGSSLSEYENLPASFSWLDPEASPPANSYDDLFYVDGSPLVCPPSGDEPYTFHGGFLDIFGVMFSLANGNYVDLWSDGVVPPGVFGPTGGLTFGMNVFEPAEGGGFTAVSMEFSGVTAAVPEPSFLWLFGAGVLGLFAWRRTVETRKQVSLTEG